MIATTMTRASWEQAPLADVVDVLDRYRVPVNAGERANRIGRVPYYGATGQVGWIDDYLFDEDLVLLGEDGAPFLDSTKPVAYMVRGKAWVNNHAHVLRARDGILNSFLMHQLNQTDFRTYVSGTTRLKLPQGPMNEIPILVPPTSEQHRIVAVPDSHLSRLDAAVAALERVQRTLARYRASVLHAAVTGRLVPTEAELARIEGREYEPASALLARILGERRQRWAEGELAKMIAAGKAPKDDRWKARYVTPVAPETEVLPELPEGWSFTGIGALLPPGREGMVTGPFGSLLKKHEHQESGIPVIGIENVEPMHFVPGSKIHLSREKADQLAKYNIRSGDIAISRSGTVGEVCVIPDLEGEARFSTNVMRVRLAVGCSMPEYLVLSLWGDPFVRGQITQLCSGTTREFLNQEILSALVFALPPVAEQRRIVAAVEAHVSWIGSVASQARKNVRRLTRLRQSILRLAFEGRLVPQDPTDEPAAALLARIRAERAAGSGGAGRRQRRGVGEQERLL